ncbi:MULTISPECIES: DUF924 family protein [unclassified Marinimicrobium]|jgi:uncharacterized protein (DUF924 family)|uniref:DUF924 family protein n=1 Tax=unclassified Marinimicrobium TaxID=2632100 RepID=UPI000C556D0B|nr:MULTISPECIES: DUF924 family protein [unclassified Marinimicrobium]MAN52616.1 hypothetical protein [Marinimicrobium sp.]|tara:strand:- start:658 stop:1218 length:561 start_codon:yes stop_codon:yes gene_type:complete
MSLPKKPQNARTVFQFWFEELMPSQWFKKDSALDEAIDARFGHLLEQAKRGELWAWRDTPEGRLAEVIVLDQFSRNIYRDRPEAFAQDALALVLAQEAVRQGADHALEPQARAFLYMPYMHSESAVIHQQALTLFDQPGLENSLTFEIRHWEIIERFGRYPHRNEILGRESTEEELRFLQEPGSSF